ncbi:MAG: hypothetical protein QXF52_02790 [Thermoproteota archaeon]
MNPGRLVGIVLGVVILVAVFILPFGIHGDTFFNLARWNMENLSVIQETGDAALIALVYVTIVSFILLVIAGIVGFFPLGCGVIGIVALALLTVGHILIYNSYGETFNVLELGVGYFVAWVASIAALAVSFWRKGQKTQQQTVNVTVVNQPQAPPPPPPPA